MAYILTSVSTTLVSSSCLMLASFRGKMCLAWQPQSFRLICFNHQDKSTQEPSHSTEKTQISIGRKGDSPFVFSKHFHVFGSSCEFMITFNYPGSTTQRPILCHWTCSCVAYVMTLSISIFDRGAHWDSSHMFPQPRCVKRESLLGRQKKWCGKNWGKKLY